MDEAGEVLFHLGAVDLELRGLFRPICRAASCLADGWQ